MANMLIRSCARTILRPKINDLKRDISFQSANLHHSQNINKPCATNFNIQNFVRQNLSRKTCHHNMIVCLANLSTVTISNSESESDEIFDFKSISPQDKKTVSKYLGLKTSFLNETNVYVSKDLRKLVFNYFFSTNGIDIEICPLHYSGFDQNSPVYLHSNVMETMPSLKEFQDNLPEFLFCHFDKSLPENFDFVQNMDNSETLMIFDNIFDALCFYQQTKLPTIVVKLLNNKIAKNSSQFDKFCIKLNNHFKKIYLWPKPDCLPFDNLRNRILKSSIDSKKIYFINSESTATEMLMKEPKEKFDQVLRNASALDHPFILKFNDLKDDVFTEFNDPTISGVQWSRFPMLNEHLKGHRPGELTIITGPTGCGKTTFVSEYSIDLCMQGVPTLWGSFEIKNIRLIKTMMAQFARKTITFSNREDFDKDSEEFSKLPLYFMKFHGQTEVEMFMKAAKHAVSALGIKHIVIDNLQFMLGMNVESNYDRFLKQDFLISSLRQFSTDYNCHMTLVAHPRKEKEEITLSNNSLYGGIKASQEADNVMIIMNKFNSRYRCQKYLQITKNRFNGSLGVVPLFFDKSTLCFSSQQQQQQHQQQQQLNKAMDQSTTATQDHHPIHHEHVATVKDDVTDVYRMRYLFEN